jgi:hypothetical protein
VIVQVGDVRRLLRGESDRPASDIPPAAVTVIEAGRHEGLTQDKTRPELCLGLIGTIILRGGRYWSADAGA